MKSFGIINIRVNPNPNIFTINGKPYRNGDKSIFDYGPYDIRIEESGYIPIHIGTVLDAENPFYINAIELIRFPAAGMFSGNVSRIEPVDPHTFLAISGTGSEKTYTIYNETLSGGIALSGAVWNKNPAYIGDRLFHAENQIFSLDRDNISLKPFDKLKPTDAVCADAASVNGDVFCPKSGTFLTGKHAGSKEKYLEATPELLRTRQSIVRTDSAFFDSSVAYVPELTPIGPHSEIARFKNETFLLSNGNIFSFKERLIEKSVPGFARIDAIENFADETLVF